MEAAGLVKRRDRGDLVDAFWDRVVFPIRDTDGSPVAFVGRRNPLKNDDDYAGPKYLNTRTTAAFTKGQARSAHAGSATVLQDSFDRRVESRWLCA